MAAGITDFGRFCNTDFSGSPDRVLLSVVTIAPCSLIGGNFRNSTSSAVLRRVFGTTGTLTPGNRTDLYRFTVTQGSQFYFNSLSVTGGTGAWRLVDPFGNVVFGPTNLGTDVDTLTLNVGGTYILLIEGTVGNSSPVNYTFAVQPTRS